ncbi:MAG: DUF4190 domain-containing protein [Planctomycetota bacterium]|nr:DUF4190 domain-containing protein [Planctomycetota bacterium]
MTQSPPPPPPKPAPAPSHVTTDHGVELLIPINRTGWSIAAGYLGLFSLLPFIGILAIIISGIAFYDFSKRPERHGRGRAIFGLVMGILTTILWLAILMPSDPPA